MSYQLKILHVNLTTGEILTETIQEKISKAFLGSRGINAKLLWDNVKPGIDPLGEDNVLIFGAGALSGTPAPCSGRTTITCKSPATGLYLKTNVGGHWGAELRFAGFDHLVVYGKSPKPVYILIKDSRVEIKDASDLWGKDVRETTETLKSKENIPDLQVACIGPAGENLVKMAAIMCSIYNAAARGGAGAVMGSKNLKAVAVKGSGAIKYARPEEFGKVAVETREAVYNDSGAAGLHRFGTSGSTLPVNEIKAYPTKNFQRGHFAGAEKLSGNYLEDSGLLKRKVGCNGCVISCHRYNEVTAGKYTGSYAGGPEYETLSALGAGCGVDEVEAVLKANELCNILGMDTISVGAVIQWAMECFEKGVISKEEAGMDLSWGNGEAVVQLTRQIAYREGLGAVLAEGVKKAAEKIGQDSWKWAIEVKGLEQSRVETRSSNAYALAFAVNPRGADHLHTECYAEFGLSPEARAVIKEITGDEKYANPYLIEKRAEIVRWHEDCYAATDCLGFCAFSSTALYGVTPERMAKLYSAAFGIDMSEEELMEAGRRIVTLEKCFNVREGATRELDTAPYRLMHEELPERKGEGAILTKDKLDRMLDEYYELHNWDKATSWPKEETLKALGLENVAVELKKMNRLP